MDARKSPWTRSRSRAKVRKGRILKQNLDEQGYRARRFDEFQQTAHMSIPVFIKEWSKTGRSAGLLMNNRRYSEIGIGRTADDLGQSYYSLIFAEPWPTIDTSYAALELVEAVNRARSKAGKPTVAADAALERLASVYAQAMAEEKTTHPKGDDPVRRLAKLREGRRFAIAALGLVDDAATAEDVLEALLREPQNSPVLIDTATHAGAGVAIANDGTPYWLLLFVRELRGN